MDTLQKPLILHERNYTSRDVTKLKSSNRIWKVADVYERQLVELFDVVYPYLRFSPSYREKRESFISKKKKKGVGNWIYFPWNGILLHMVNEEDFHILRTNRNRNLVISKEQKKLFNTCIGIVGLSIGAEIALSLSYSGTGNTMKLADFDTLAMSNLNRRKATVYDFGNPKTATIARQIYEANPYAKLTLLQNGLTRETLYEFFYNGPKPTVIFDEIDDFKMKVLLRIEARKARIPVIMLTNLGDSILIDIERYDLDGKLAIFNDLLGKLPEKILKKKITEKEKTQYAVQLVGIEHIPIKALASLFEINKTLVGRPQLSSTVTVAAGLASYLTREIILGKPIRSGRTYFSLSTLIGVKDSRVKARNRFITEFKRIFNK